MGLICIVTYIYNTFWSICIVTYIYNIFGVIVLNVFTFLILSRKIFFFSFTFKIKYLRQIDCLLEKCQPSKLELVIQT